MLEAPHHVVAFSVAQCCAAWNNGEASSTCDESTIDRLLGSMMESPPEVDADSDRLLASLRQSEVTVSEPMLASSVVIP